MTMTSLKLLALAGLALGGAAVAQQQPPTATAPAAQPIEAGEGRAVAEKLASELTSNFVYAEQAKRYAAMLRANAAAGNYDSGSHKELADRMTEDLQAVQKDGHLHVSVAESRQPRNGGGAEGGPPRNFPPLIQSAKELAPGIAYIRFSAFFGTPEELAGVKAFMSQNRNAKTLIFDLRNHHGGGLAEMDEIFPYLFAEKTALVTMEMPRAVFDQHGTPFGDAPTLERQMDSQYLRATHYAIPGADTPLRKANVYVLTSNASASAAEHFALAFKSTGRATLIGEATAGANHFGGPASIGDHFTVWMPVGRTFDIKSGKDWEGDGIAPDIAVDPKQGLVVALEKAGLSHEEAVRIDATEVPAEPVHRDKLRAR